MLLRVIPMRSVQANLIVVDALIADGALAESPFFLQR